jgi:hypothetical protein
LYADYERRMIRICDGATCKDLHHDSLMPGWPVMSPDDKRVGFVAMDGSPRLRVVDKVGEHERDLGPAAIECPPVWGDPRTIWSFSGAGAQREWVEIDVDTGRRTGRSKAAVSFDPDKLWCGWESDGPESLFFRPARPVVRETTQLLRLPASELRD